MKYRGIEVVIQNMATQRVVLRAIHQKKIFIIPFCNYYKHLEY